MNTVFSPTLKNFFTEFHQKCTFVHFLLPTYFSFLMASFTSASGHLHVRAVLLFSPLSLTHHVSCSSFKLCSRCYCFKIPYPS